MYLALDTVFVSQTAEALGVYPDRVGLVERRRESDPALLHLAMALRAGVRSGRTGDRMYGEALSTAVGVHLLHEYSGTHVRPQHPQGRLPMEKLKRAVEYIQDQLHTDLTVSGIARTVHMSPHHFTRLFKQSTGQSPYHYVIEARVRKAKELLRSRKFSIAEVAHIVGFADQSHLTRRLKHFFGITPKMLMERQYPERNYSEESQKPFRALSA
jgi:AraC family transcriptional regulator